MGGPAARGLTPRTASPVPRPQPGPGPAKRPPAQHLLGRIQPARPKLALGHRIRSDGRPPPPPPPRRNKTRRPAETLSHFLLPLSLSCERRRPRGRRPWRPRRSDEAAPPWLARRHARSPLGEHAIIELAIDGASLWSPRTCVPASRRLAAALCRRAGACAARRRSAVVCAGRSCRLYPQGLVFVFAFLFLFSSMICLSVLCFFQFVVESIFPNSIYTLV